ncbi:MAG: hypothetical protein RIC51_04200 [Erythrobacter sp.]|uniref:hypothetical protein n=1 Tax=Erythrobacter sp. TaxID=1042 RepID=UPI0032EC6BE8
MKAFFVAIFSVLLFACGARAEGEAYDFRAVYSAGNGALEMTLEYSADGDLRVEEKGQDMWLLRRDEVNYFVIPQEDGAAVLDTRIMSKLMRNVMPDNLPLNEAPQLELVEAGETEINGRQGTGYRLASAPSSGPFFIVLSSDDSLSRLGDAMLAQLRSSVELNPLAGNSFDNVLDIMATGAPISYAGADLTSFEMVELDPSVFELPSEPLDEAGSRQLMIERGMIPSEKMELPSFED